MASYSNHQGSGFDVSFANGRQNPPATTYYNPPATTNHILFPQSEPIVTQGHGGLPGTTTTIPLSQYKDAMKILEKFYKEDMEVLGEHAKQLKAEQLESERLYAASTSSQSSSSFSGYDDAYNKIGSSSKSSYASSSASSDYDYYSDTSQRTVKDSSHTRNPMAMVRRSSSSPQQAPDYLVQDFMNKYGKYKDLKERKSRRADDYLTTDLYPTMKPLFPYIDSSLYKLYESRKNSARSASNKAKGIEAPPSKSLADLNKDLQSARKKRDNAKTSKEKDHYNAKMDKIKKDIKKLSRR